MLSSVVRSRDVLKATHGRQQCEDDLLLQLWLVEHDDARLAKDPFALLRLLLCATGATRAR